MSKRRRILIVFVLIGLCCSLAWGADWPQLQNGPQHTGYSAEYLGPPYSVKWTVSLAPEKIYPATQAVIVGGKLFVGTKEGTLYALDASTGGELWTYPAGGGIYHTVAVENGKVFFAGMDGYVYAVDTSGNWVWDTQCERRHGFSAAVLAADGKIFVGNRSGNFYALSQSDGQILWSYPCDGPIFQTAAYDASGDYVAFTAEDMCLYVLEADTGDLHWKSRKVQGQSFRDNYAMIHQGKIITRAMHRNETSGVSGGGGMFVWDPASYIAQYYSDIISGSLPATDSTQQSIINNYTGTNNVRQDLFVFDIATGNEIVVPQWGCGTMAGPIGPAAVWSNLLVVPVYFDRASWGMLDLSTQRVTQVLKEDGGGGTLSTEGSGNADEHLNVSVAGDTIFTLHVQEGNAHFTGSFDMNSRQWTGIAATGAQAFFNNNQGGGGNAGSISNGVLYHIKYHCIIARQCTTQ